MHRTWTLSYLPSVGKYILEQDGKPEPFSGLHLLCHCGDSCQTRRVQQVEHQEGEGCHGCREPCRNTARYIYCILGISRYVGKHSHGCPRCLLPVRSRRLWIRIPQEPHDNTRQEQNSSGFDDELLHPLVSAHNLSQLRLIIFFIYFFAQKLVYANFY